jgi:hypothetical protein
MNAEKDLLYAKINGETSRMQWTELLRFFAAGTVIAVSDDLDLVDVAMRIANDDKNAVQQWMTEGRVGKVSDAQASAWLDADATLWTVVVKPWILVQQRAN